MNYNVGFNEATSTFTASFNDAIIIGSDGSSAISEMVTPISYANLKELRDNSQMTAGLFYRIIDFV